MRGPLRPPFPPVSDTQCSFCTPTLYGSSTLPRLPGFLRTLFGMNHSSTQKILSVSSVRVRHSPVEVPRRGGDRDSPKIRLKDRQTDDTCYSEKKNHPRVFTKPYKPKSPCRQGVDLTYRNRVTDRKFQVPRLYVRIPWVTPGEWGVVSDTTRIPKTQTSGDKGTVDVPCSRDTLG